MKSHTHILLTFLLLQLLAAVPLTAQRIFYSEPDRDDSRNIQFEILGKYNNNYLVYKNYRNRHYISIYTAEMKQKDKVLLDFIPERVSSVDVFSNPENVVVIYQYSRKNTVYCMGVRIDGNGKTIGEPVQLDTTQLNAGSDSKIYTALASDDRQKFMVFKMRNRYRDEFQFQTLLLSNNLLPIRKAAFTYQIENNKDAIADFYLDNEGNFLFTHVMRQGQKEYISRARLCVLRTYEDSVKVYPLRLTSYQRSVVRTDGRGTAPTTVTVNIEAEEKAMQNGETFGLFLDELRIKVDNTNGRYILASFYSKSRRGNIDGLFLAVVNKDLETPDIERVFEFDEDLRKAARGESRGSVALNDFYIKHFIVKRDGGVLMTAESAYSSSQGNNFNRWDNPWLWGQPWGGGFWGWNSPWMWNSPWGWGSPWMWNTPWGWNSFGGRQQVRYYADNIIVLSFDKDAMLDWTSIVAKQQFDDNSDILLSYQIMNSGAELLFLYNEWNRRNPLLSAQSLDPTGKVKREQPLRSLDRGYQFMIRFGKQVSAREMLVPVVYRNTYCFARIEF
ncbi:MAG: hypothetical protein ACK4E8_05365 [Lacibacter sp.]